MVIFALYNMCTAPYVNSLDSYECDFLYTLLLFLSCIHKAATVAVRGLLYYTLKCQLRDVHLDNY